MTSADQHGVYLTHEEHAALLAERDRLREALEEAENAPDPDHHCPSFRHVMDVIGAALKGDQI